MVELGVLYDYELDCVDLVRVEAIQLSDPGECRRTEGSLMDVVHVVDVLDGNTLVIKPPWQVGTEQGHLIRINGMHADPLSVPQGQIARCKLTLLLIGTCIQISYDGTIEDHALVCDVVYQGHPLETHFPEYRTRPVIFKTPIISTSIVDAPSGSSEGLQALSGSLDGTGALTSQGP